MFAQALEEEKEKEEGEDAQQVFKITYVRNLIFQFENVWFGENLDSPKAGWRGGDGCC